MPAAAEVPALEPGQVARRRRAPGPPSNLGRPRTWAAELLGRPRTWAYSISAPGRIRSQLLGIAKSESCPGAAPIAPIDSYQFAQVAVRIRRPLGAAAVRIRRRLGAVAVRIRRDLGAELFPGRQKMRPGRWKIAGRIRPSNRGPRGVVFKQVIGVGLARSILGEYSSLAPPRGPRLLGQGAQDYRGRLNT